MKILPITLQVVMQFFITVVSVAQSFEYIVPYGYNSRIGAIALSAKGDWILAVHHDSVPGHYYTDTLSLVCLGASGILQYKVNVIPPYFDERIEIDELIPLPDSGCIISYGANNCDVWGYNICINRYDKDGQLVWAKRNMPFQSEDMILSGTGELLVYTGRKINRIDLQDGSVLESIHVSGGNHSGVFYNAAGDLIFQTGNRLYYGRISTSHVFEILDTLDFISEYPFFKSAKIGSNGSLLSYAEYYKAILEIDAELQVDTLLSLQEQPADFWMDQHFVYVIPEQDADQRFELDIYSHAGAYIKSYSLGDEWVWGASVFSDNIQLVVTGEMFTWPNLLQDVDVNSIGRSQAWVKVCPLTALNFAPGTQSISIVDVKANSNLVVQEIQTGYMNPSTVFSFWGGAFEVEVLNTGQDKITSCWVNIAFGYSFFNICGSVDARQVHYPDLNLDPGESIVLYFGDIVGYRQEQNPDNLCFFTSGPNGLPDATPADDVFCTNPLFTPPEIETPFSIQPNPTSGQLFIKMADLPTSVRWELITLLGQPIAHGWILPDTNEHEIDLSQIVPGLYVIRIGNFIRKVVIE